MAQQGPSGRRGALTREVVLSTALQLVDEEGLQALTMRRLGQRLQRDPMALYRHASGRAELLEGVVETVFAALEVPEERVTWQEWMRRVAHGVRALARAHPNIVPLLATRSLATPLGLGPIGTLLPLERILDLLVAAGFAPADALRVYRAYAALLIGHVLTELQEVPVESGERAGVERLGLQRLPAEEYPHLRALAEALTPRDGGAELDEVLDVLLAGLSARHGPQRTDG